MKAYFKLATLILGGLMGAEAQGTLLSDCNTIKSAFGTQLGVIVTALPNKAPCCGSYTSGVFIGCGESVAWAPSSNYTKYYSRFKDRLLSGLVVYNFSAAEDQEFGSNLYENRNRVTVIGITGSSWSSIQGLNPLQGLSKLSRLDALMELYLFGFRSSLEPLPTIPFSSFSNLRTLTIAVNGFQGPVPSEIGSLTKLHSLFLHNNSFTGVIPTEFGNLSKLKILTFNGNNITGVPSTLRNLPLETLVMKPNPLTGVPYILASKHVTSTLNSTDIGSVLGGLVSFRKRQFLSSLSSISDYDRSTTLSTDQLYALCPLNDVQSADVPVGCIAGVYRKYCLKDDLFDCRDAYTRIFGASIFKSLGLSCPPWLFGPSSLQCVQAIANFNVDLGYVNLTSFHASEINKAVFRKGQYAPCINTATVKCKW
jgi:hypothetical protein